MKPLTPFLLALTVWLFADPGAAQESPVNADIVTSAPVVLEGRVLTEDGLPAAGAVVVSSAGGQTVTESNGTFQLEVVLPHGAQSVQVKIDVSDFISGTYFATVFFDGYTETRRFIVNK